MSADYRVLLIMGSDSDWQVMSEASRVLREFGVNHEVRVTSAHRTPARTSRLIAAAEEAGCRVIIAGAGAAAHLAGVVAAQTILPVIGIPLNATALQGMDALLATVQMPGGIPVATMAIGKAGAVNAAYMAIQILALNDDELRVKLQEDRVSKAKKVELDSKEIEVIL
jgi:5-(carboxyamino)imidazole ribonucleotide mutase